MRRTYFHIGAFNANQYLSLAPSRIDFGEFASYADAAFEGLWRTVFLRVWGQWRYENALPFYSGPVFPISASSRDPVAYRRSGRALFFSGGGKDSVVAQAALAESGQPYDSLSYSHSVYGVAWHQHELIDGVLNYGAQGQRNRISIFDDFLDSPVLRRGGYGVSTMCSAETPASVFMSLPSRSHTGTTDFIVGHERSADFGNFIWSMTGEEINHQWGKTLEAERLLSTYVAEHLLEGFRYYSILKPFSDIAIFSLGAGGAPFAAEGIPGVAGALGGYLRVRMDFEIDERDLRAFLVYATRERTLDASLRAASKYGRSAEHQKSIDALRELNAKMLFRETHRHNRPF